ncbi:hypothetical protein, partial [Acidaminococcus timonensis]|uniref:hypothetical protein n=1 Tax=Acidaminococcus timonensis TaxID=1871002 RepID=UPI00307FE8EA
YIIDCNAHFFTAYRKSIPAGRQYPLKPVLPKDYITGRINRKPVTGLFPVSRPFSALDKWPRETVLYKGIDCLLYWYSFGAAMHL